MRTESCGNATVWKPGYSILQVEGCLHTVNNKANKMRRFSAVISGFSGLLNFHKDISKFAGNHQTSSYLSCVFHAGHVGTWFSSGIGSAGLMIGSMIFHWIPLDSMIGFHEKIHRSFPTSVILWFYMQTLYLKAISRNSDWVAKYLRELKTIP